MSIVEGIRGLVLAAGPELSASAAVIVGDRTPSASFGEPTLRIREKSIDEGELVCVGEVGLK